MTPMRLSFLVAAAGYALAAALFVGVYAVFAVWNLNVTGFELFLQAIATFVGVAVGGGIVSVTTVWLWFTIQDRRHLRAGQPIGVTLSKQQP